MQTLENQKGSVSVEIESLNSSSSKDESTETPTHWEESDDKKAHEKEACENSKSRKLEHGKERAGKEAREEDNSAAPVSLETQVLDRTWMPMMEERLLVLPKIIKASSSKFFTSIHKVPHILSRQAKNAYVPQVVSIGPLHRNKRQGHLQAVEEHKWKYLNEIVRRKGKAWFEQCMVAVKEKEEEARECYSQVFEELDSYSFVKIMVLDGCFIVELFRKNWFGRFEDDPIFQLKWLRRLLWMDLLMLENQIPFFILQTVFDLLEISCFSLEAAALKYFHGWFNYGKVPCKITRTGSFNLHIHHLLDLLHKNIVLSTEEEYPTTEASDSIQCASKLHESGIKFKKRDDINFLDIKFDEKKGIIEIPRVVVEDGTNAIFRNLIAFEQCYLYCKKYITTYTCFMDDLMNNSKDVEILVRNGIIVSGLGSDNDVARLFNHINKEVIVPSQSFYLASVCKEINRYCKRPLPKLRATLMHDYFKNPWAVISVIAAVLLLLLTFTQAFFAVFPKFAVGK